MRRSLRWQYPRYASWSGLLSQGYEVSVSEIAEAIRRLIDAANVVVNRPAVEAGLAVLDAGGDFADGVIAYEGNWLGAEIFVSFDKKAVKLMEAQGLSARLLSQRDWSSAVSGAQGRN
jgi:predicted nucleic-acid-binding protein